MAASLPPKHSPPASKRKQIFQRCGFQWRFTVLTVGSLAVLLLFTCLHGLLMVQRVVPAELIGPVLPELQSATVRLALVGLLYIGVVALAAVFLSHRAVGPLGRLEDEIKKMTASTNVDGIKVREGDDLEQVVHAFNELIRKIKGHNK